jgi:hypothetical protein
MAETQWLYLERRAGRVRRVTLLDDDLRVIATHEREPVGDQPPDDCQLVRAVELSSMAAVVEATG